MPIAGSSCGQKWSSSTCAFRDRAGANGGRAPRSQSSGIPVFETAGDHRGLGRAWLLSRLGRMVGAAATTLPGGRQLKRALVHYRRSTWPTSICLGEIAVALYFGPDSGARGNRALRGASPRTRRSIGLAGTHRRIPRRPRRPARRLRRAHGLSSRPRDIALRRARTAASCADYCAHRSRRCRALAGDCGTQKEILERSATSSSRRATSAISQVERAISPRRCIAGTATRKRRMDGRRRDAYGGGRRRRPHAVEPVRAKIAGTSRRAGGRRAARVATRSDSLRDSDALNRVRQDAVGT